MNIVPSRRGFITGAVAALIAAPAIVRAGSLMPVKAILELNEYSLEEAMIAINRGYAITNRAINFNLYGSYVVTPEVVYRLGDGSIVAGHGVLNRMVRSMRNGNG